MLRVAFSLTLILSVAFNDTVAQTAVDTTPRSNKTLSVIWQQQSAEYRALCYQAFNIAKWRLEKTKIKRRYKYAIITDIDETVLDNSYQEADNIRQNKEFAKDTWKAWTDKAKATPVPGALEFLQMAKKKGVSIFYISNRDTTEVNSTVANLAQYQFPDADRKHMIFQSGTSSKEERRLSVTKDYRVIMLLGDNLNDFTQLFEKKSNGDRLLETDKVKDEWGRKFIVLPNATYGEWENAAYDYQRNLTPDQKNQKLVEKIIGSEK
jgi:5'-nucleotidase (lipoprotein e(P4) family)